MSKNQSGVSRRSLLKLGLAASAAAGATVPTWARAQTQGEGADNAAAPGSTEETLPQVPRRVLGKTGESVPILLMGAAMKLDTRFDPKLAEAFRFGVNYIDAADCYTNGTCETAVGNFHSRAELRKDLWITSKSDLHDPKGFEKTVVTSLEKMQTDYINMYFLHALEDGSVLNDDLKVTVERLKKEGKIQHFGFSCHHGNVVELLNRAAETPWVETVMFRYNFRKYGDSELNRAIDKCVAANVGLIAMKTQASEASFQDAWKKFEGTGKWTKHQAVLKAVWADDRITAAVSHMDTFESLKQNIAAAVDRTELGAADWKGIHEYAAATRGNACDGCDHLCNAAVHAPVRIGDTLRYLMYHDVYGDREHARELFAKLPTAARQLDNVDFAGANAACPHGVDVAAEMKRASRVLNA